jgi:hypothetical protein
VYPKVSGLSHNEIYAYNNKPSLIINTKYYGAKLTRLVHKIAIQLHLVAEGCTICSFRSRRPVRKLLDTPAYLFVAYLTTLCYTQCCGGHDPNLFQCTRQEITRKIWTRCLQWYDLQTDSHKYRTISGAKIVTAFNCCVEVILASTV